MLISVFIFPHPQEYYKDPDSISVYDSALKSILYHLDESESGVSSKSSVWPPWPWPQPDDPPNENRTARAERCAPSFVLNSEVRFSLFFQRLSQDIISFESKLATYGADRFVSSIAIHVSRRFTIIPIAIHCLSTRLRPTIRTH
jgi:hypothetical protein